MKSVSKEKEGKASLSIDYGVDKIRMNIWVRKNLWEGVMDIAKEEDMSVSDVVRDALKNHIRRHKTKIGRS